MTAPSQNQSGSVLLITLVITGLIASLSLSFAATMGSRIRVVRNESAALQADLVAQSGLEHAKRRLLLDPQWTGTGDAPMTLSNGSEFTVMRLPGQTSPYLPTEVTVVVEGRDETALARFDSQIEVDPGDPLLTKAVSVLGENVSGSNIHVMGDYLVLDRAGWLWTFRADLLPVVQGDARFAAVADDEEDKLRYDLSDGFYKTSYFDDDDDCGDEYDYELEDELTEEQMREWKQHVQRLYEAGYLSDAAVDALRTKLTAYLDARALLPVRDVNPPPDDDYHLTKSGTTATGVWQPSAAPFRSTIALDRMDATGSLHHYATTDYAWEDDQQIERRPVHAPGWILDGYLDGADPRIRLFDGVTEVAGLECDETVVFLLAAGETLTLTDVHFRGGLVIWCEEDFDFRGDARNTLTLQGSCRFGGGGLGVADVGVIAPGTAITVGGVDAHYLTGYSVVHSLMIARRIHSDGIMIVLNDLVDLVDSQFIHDSTIAPTPAEGLHFFGGPPTVDVQLVREKHDVTP